MRRAEMLRRSDKPDVSIIVVNWEGEEWLARCLSSLQLSARHSGRACEMIVVDDASTDGSVALVRERFPKAVLLANPHNRGFAWAVTRGVLAARGRHVVLCNNDLVAREEFVGELLAPFEGTRAKRLFAVSARTMGWYDGKPNQLCMGAVWKGGRLTPAWSDPSTVSRCLFVQAGAAAYRRDLWMKLGGLASLYEPGYWEDYDLSWRAAKAGLEQVYAPRALALHVGGGSMRKRYGDEGVERMKARNHLLFEMANLSSPRLLAEWSARLPLNVMRQWPGYARGLADAAPRLAAALARRVSLPRVVPDSALLDRTKDFTPSY
jgi:hypothetical protein